MNQRGDRGRSARPVFAQVGYQDFAIMRECGPTAFSIYIFLALRLGKNETAWPSYRDIRAHTGIASNSTIKAAIDKLVAFGVLKVEQRRSAAGSLTSNLYTLLSPLSESDPGTESVQGCTESVQGCTEIGQPPITEIGQPPSTISVQELDSSSEVDSIPESDSSLAPVSRRDSYKNRLFEAIAEAWKGEPYHPRLLTRSQQALVGTVTAQLMQIGADPLEVPREWAALRARFDNPTPAALVKHWGTHGTGPRAVPPNGSAKQVAQARHNREVADTWLERMKEYHHAGPRHIPADDDGIIDITARRSNG